MERLPRIILMIVAMTAIFLWISSAFTSCGEKDLVSDSKELVSNTADNAEDFADDLGEDIFGDDNDDDMFISSDDDDYSDEDEYVEGDEAVDTDFTDTSYDEPEETYQPTSTKTYGSGGEYMVIAGNYLVESNAREMTRKLANLGYGSAEIGVFERSQYHTVIASRHSSNSAAIQTANDIKNRGVDCYVKKKTY